MKDAEDPIGADNDRTLMEIAGCAGVIIAAWGNNGAYLGRDEEVRKMIPRLYCLKMTNKGYPTHPLYLPRGLKPKLYLPRGLRTQGE